ncbi:MAG: ferritin-like domain-containing protein [Alphaproteobacteria bacterium]|nr:ferritin-like domain-containing protein [Alphaproteobacteria bacterium]MCW5740521.1 ferritin-like domain-containing protein [Alphaproteobacteria bacterium]
MKNWTLDDIAWDRFDSSKVDPEILKIVKAAAMVERNGVDYGVYLSNVFADDQEFRALAPVWAQEEVVHGMALGRWAQMADPSFDFDGAFKTFTESYKLPLDSTTSVRGTRSGELMARCIVETGTSTFYTALRDRIEEPVLKQVCAFIAADELRHYKLFYTHMRRYLEVEGLGRFGRLRVGLGRLRELEDDELACAYFAANAAPGEAYDRKRFTGEYMRRAYAIYRPGHLDRGVAMILKAAGLPANGRLRDWVTRLGYRVLRSRVAKFDRAAAAV